MNSISLDITTDQYRETCDGAIGPNNT